MTDRPRGAATTGLGDLPYRDVDTALDRVWDAHPELPYWPRLPKRDRREGMIGQFLGRFPYLQLRRPTPTLSVEGDSPELARAIDEIRARSGDATCPELGEAEAAAWHGLLGRITALPKADRPSFVKGQITGPLTAASLAKDLRGRPLATFPGALEAVATFLGDLALDQARKISELGATPIVFVDEPLLARLDPANDGETIERVTTILRATTHALHDAGALVALSCEGRFSWPVLFGLDVDWIAFDVDLALDSLREHADAALAWIEAGRGFAFGIVPIGSFDESFDAERRAAGLVESLTAALGSYQDARRLVQHSLLTPASGTLMQSEATDLAITTALAETSTRLRKMRKSICFRISSGTSVRSFSLALGRITVRIPDRCAASTFSFTPPIGRISPRSEISPVIATSCRTGRRLKSEASASVTVTPADGPSLGTAPSGKCTWMSRSSNSSGSICSSSARDRT